MNYEAFIVEVQYGHFYWQFYSLFMDQKIDLRCMHLMSLMFLCIMHTTYRLCNLLTLVNHCLFFSLFGGEILPAGQNHLLKTFGIKYEKIIGGTFIYSYIQNMTFDFLMVALARSQ